jgi:hypothetical protein
MLLLGALFLFIYITNKKQEGNSRNLEDCITTIRYARKFLICYLQKRELD